MPPSKPIPFQIPSPPIENLPSGEVRFQRGLSGQCFGKKKTASAAALSWTDTAWARVPDECQRCKFSSDHSNKTAPSHLCQSRVKYSLYLHISTVVSYRGQASSPLEAALNGQPPLPCLARLICPPPATITTYFTLPRPYRLAAHVKARHKAAPWPGTTQGASHGSDFRVTFAGGGCSTSK